MKTANVSRRLFQSTRSADGEPADVVELVDADSRWLQTSRVPKPFINADPGAILTGA